MFIGHTQDEAVPAAKLLSAGRDVMAAPALFVRSPHSRPELTLSNGSPPSRFSLWVAPICMAMCR